MLGRWVGPGVGLAGLGVFLPWGFCSGVFGEVFLDQTLWVEAFRRLSLKVSLEVSLEIVGRLP